MRMHRAWLVAASMVAGLPAAAAAQQQGTALAMIYRFIEGNGMAIERPGTPAAVAGAQGDVLLDRDLVGTNNTTRAALKFTDDGTLIRMNPGTRMTIQRGTAADRQSGVKTVALDAGTLWAKVTRGPARSFQVQTPAGVAAVKGTEFIVSVGPNGETTVITLEGTVEFFNQGGSADVGAGKTVNVPNNNSAPNPRDTQDADITNTGSAPLINSDVGVVDDDTVEVQIRLSDANGREKIMFLVLPRTEARAILGGGGN
jgi:hypothetical protein